MMKDELVVEIDRRLAVFRATKNPADCPEALIRKALADGDALDE